MPGEMYVDPPMERVVPSAIFDEPPDPNATLKALEERRAAELKEVVAAAGTIIDYDPLGSGGGQ